MKLTTMRRGDKDYVYLCTSKRIKGRKNPVVVKRYVGILDRKTGLVTPRKVPPETFLAQIQDGEFTCQDLGNILVARKAAEALDMPRYLEGAFGENWRTVYALILVIAVNPLCSSDYTAYASKYYLDDVIGKRALTAKDIDRALGDFRGRMPAIYSDMRDIDSRLAFIIDWTPSGDVPFRTAARRGGEVPIPERMFYIITDDRGNPLFLWSSARDESASESLRVAASRAKATGGTITFVLGGPVPTETLAVLVGSGVHLVADADAMLDDGDEIARLVTDFADDWTVRDYESARYNVLEIGVGLLQEGGGFRAVFGMPDRMDDAALVLRAAVWYDPDEFERRLSDLSRVTRQKADALRNMPIETARSHLMDGSTASQLLSVYERDDGSVGVRVRRKMRKQVAMRSSTHVLVSDCMSWEESMRCMAIREDVISHSRPMVQVAMDRKERSGYSYLYLAFMSMAIRMNVERTMRERGIGRASADEVFQTVSSYRAVRVNDHVYRSSVSREAESIFEVFEVTLPSQDERNPRQGPSTRVDEGRKSGAPTPGCSSGPSPIKLGDRDRHR